MKINEKIITQKIDIMALLLFEVVINSKIAKVY
jgi:hypothetical protein